MSLILLIPFVKKKKKKNFFPLSCLAFRLFHRLVSPVCKVAFTERDKLSAIMTVSDERTKPSGQKGFEK